MRKIDLLWIGVAIVIDQISKMIIEAFLELGESITIIPNFFSITYARNTGAAFSILEGQMTFFYIISIVALFAMSYYSSQVRPLRSNSCLSVNPFTVLRTTNF